MIAHSLKQVTLDHLKLNYYVSKRKKAKATLALLHGMYNTHKLFYPLIEKLDNEYNIVALDLPGFGGSTADEAFQPEQLPELLHKFLTRLKLPDIYLIGFSLGGTIGVEYAARFPESIKGLIMISAPTKTRYIGKLYLDLAELAKNPEALKIMISQKDSPLVQALVSFATALPDVKYLKYHKADVVREIVSGTNYDAVSRYCRYLLDFDLAPQINMITVPILAVYGGKDVACLDKCAPEVSALNPLAQVYTFPNFTHNAQIDKTGLLSELVIEFCSGDPR
jgi:pimeloyl-ACP methyl ester carboxylesterase